LSKISDISLYHAKVESEIMGRFCENFSNLIISMKLCLHRRYNLLNDVEESSKIAKKKRDSYDKLKFSSLRNSEKMERARVECEEAEKKEKHLREENQRTQKHVIQELNDCESTKTNIYCRWIHDLATKSLDLEKKILEELRHDKESILPDK